MPVTNLGRLHLTAAQKTAIYAALTTIETQILAVTINLNAEERNKFGSVNEANKLFVNKDREYFQTQPTLASPDVDWVEFEAYYQDRILLMSLLALIIGVKPVTNNVHVAAFSIFLLKNE